MPEPRAPRREEAGAIADALNAHSRRLAGTADSSAAEVEAWFGLPGLDPERDLRVVERPEGGIAGYADVAGGEGDEPLWLDLRLRPGCAWAGPPLLDAMEARAAERGWPARPLRAHVHPDDDAVALVRSRGYRPIRSSFTMEVGLAAEPPPPAWPEGLRPRPYAPGADDERVYEAHMDAFADHWGFHRSRYDEWRHWSTAPPHDPALWFVVEDAGELAAVCLCRPRRGEEEGLGWVDVLGVRPPWRRRGLARALLLHAFRALRARGCDRAGLTVDAENVTGAVALYESVGMRQVRRTDVYEKMP